MLPARMTLSSTLVAAAVGLLTPGADAQWSVTNLHSGVSNCFATGTSDTQQVGSVNVATGFVLNRASLWNSSAASRVDLTPAGAAQSEATGISGTQQVGWAEFDGVERAGLWSGTAESWVDLSTEFGGLPSFAYGTSGAQQVGAFFSGGFGGGTFVALLWNGTAESVVVLSPSGSDYAIAYATSGAQQVGSVAMGGISRASLWSGTAESWVDLSPAGATRSSAVGVSGSLQVGSATIDGVERASLWSGTAESWIDLNPPGATRSAATGVSGPFQVGWAEIDSVRRAGIWHGTPDSWQDLSQWLVGSSAGWGSWTRSEATGVWSDGQEVRVSGFGYNVLTVRTEALLWSHPVATACPADLTGDDLLSFSDVALWLQAFNAQGPSADFNNDGVLSFSDVQAYLAAFNAGCP